MDGIALDVHGNVYALLALQNKKELAQAQRVTVC